MKKLMYVFAICSFGSLAFAAPTPLFESEGPQLRVENRIDIPKGATGLIFSAGKVSADFAVTSACVKKENVCVLETLELAKARDRYLDVNAILSIQDIYPMCEGRTGFVARVSTQRNQFKLRCNMTSSVPTAEELQSILSQNMTVQYPSKID